MTFVFLHIELLPSCNSCRNLQQYRFERRIKRPKKSVWSLIFLFFVRHILGSSSEILIHPTICRPATTVNIPFNWGRRRKLWEYKMTQMCMLPYRSKEWLYTQHLIFHVVKWIWERKICRWILRFRNWKLSSYGTKVWATIRLMIKNYYNIEIAISKYRF